MAQIAAVSSGGGASVSTSSTKSGTLPWYGYVAIGAGLIVMGNTRFGPFVALALVAVLTYWVLNK